MFFKSIYVIHFKKIICFLLIYIYDVYYIQINNLKYASNFKWLLKSKHYS